MVIGRRSGAAEGLKHAFVRLRRLGIASECRLVLVRPLEHGQELLERFEITPLNSGHDRGFDLVVARDESRVHRLHGGPPGIGVLGFLLKPLPPSAGPGVEGRRVDEEAAYRLVPTLCRVGQPPEGQREVSAVLRHSVQEVAYQAHVVVALGEKADLAPQPGMKGRLETGSEAAEGRFRCLPGFAGVIREDRQERLGEPGEVPMRDRRLVRVGIATGSGRSS